MFPETKGIYNRPSTKQTVKWPSSGQDWVNFILRYIIKLLKRPTIAIQNRPILYGIISILLIIFIIELFKETLVIEPIKVPEELVKVGLNPETISLQLSDEIKKVFTYESKDIGSSVIFPKPDFLKYRPDIIVPTLGISFQSAVRLFKFRGQVYD
jgi:hypothetical protein